MIPFSVTLPNRVRYAAGTVEFVQEIVTELCSKGSAVLVPTDKGIAGTGVPARVVASLDAAGFASRLVDTVPAEPTDTDLDGIATSIRSTKSTAIVAIGGGSVMGCL